MIKSFILIFMLFLASWAHAQDIKCKTEFTFVPYKKNFFGKLVRDNKEKFKNSFVEGTMSVEMPINKDGSAFFTYSSHNEGSKRITTYYKTQKGSLGPALVSMNFVVLEKYLTQQVDIELIGPRSEFIELEEPVFWRQQGNSKIMIEKIYYNCKLQTTK